MQQTSLLAYSALDLPRREKQVLDVIRLAKIGITNLEIGKYLNLPINCITGRTNSLFKKKIIKYGQKRPDFYTKSTCITYIFNKNVIGSSIGNEGALDDKMNLLLKKLPMEL